MTTDLCKKESFSIKDSRLSITQAIDETGAIHNNTLIIFSGKTFLFSVPEILYKKIKMLTGKTESATLIPETKVTPASEIKNTLILKMLLFIR